MTHSASLDFVARAANGHLFSESDMAQALSEMVRGEWSDVAISAFLTALKVRGETLDELVGAAHAMRQFVRRVDFGPALTMDTCGTGGDHAGTFNISTTVAFVVASAGIRVAKHGNRSVSSQCGSADVLEALGLCLQVDDNRLQQCMAQTGFAFLFAPYHHAAMRHVASVRRALGFRTLFNLVGPLVNPAFATHQLIGIYDKNRLFDVGQALSRLGVRRALCVHGNDGLDEITLSGVTHAVLVDEGSVTPMTIDPQEYGFPLAATTTLAGGNAPQNAALIRDILRGDHTGPCRDVVTLNAGAALFVANAAPTILDGVRTAANLISSGASFTLLETVVRITQEPPP